MNMDSTKITGSVNACS